MLFLHIVSFASKKYTRNNFGFCMLVLVHNLKYIRSLNIKRAIKAIMLIANIGVHI